MDHEETLNMHRDELSVHRPLVTVIMPIRNESQYIHSSLKSVLAQDYPQECLEILVVDGLSTDGTRELVANYIAYFPNVRLIDNPQKIVSTALNLGIREARGDILIRVDGHCEIEPDYIRHCVQHLLIDKVDCVGGPIDTIGESVTAEAIAIAMSSRFGVGDSPFRTIRDRSMLVDSVAFPAYTRKVIERIGLFDEELVRDQDDEYNYRLRKFGGKILLSPDIRSRYYSRSSLFSLWKQYFQYGFWKVRVFQKHPRQMRLRQFVPPAFAASLLIPLLGSLFIPQFILLIGMILALYGVASTTASMSLVRGRNWKHFPLLPIAFLILHLGYGLGFLVGLVKFAGRWTWAREISRPPEPQKAFHLGIQLLYLFDQLARRSLDIVASTIGLLLLSPIFLMIGLLIRRDSPGPILYKGQRVGKNGRIFQIYKFRTMYEQAASSQGPKITGPDDPRITKIGEWLRETKLNELPQLWNVLKGDMSLVGPRPEDPFFVAKWSEEVRHEILSVRPGITSPASVIYRNEEALLKSVNVMDKYLYEVLPTKIRFDQVYVRNRTFLSDLDVILLTIIAVLARVKKLSIPRELLYWGPIHRFARRQLVWFGIDLVVAFLSVGAAGLIWRLSAPLDIGLRLSVIIGFAIALLFSIINTMMGMYIVSWSRATINEAVNLGISFALVTTALSLANVYLYEDALLPPGLILVAGAIAFTGFISARYRNQIFTHFANWFLSTRRHALRPVSERILIVGAGEVSQFAVWMIQHGGINQAFTIVGLVDDDPRKVGMRMDGIKVIGMTSDIPVLVQTRDIGVILYAISNSPPWDKERILSICRSIPVRTVLIPEILDILRANFPLVETEQEQAVQNVLDSTRIDPFTGVYNRQHLRQVLDAEVLRARRYKRPLSIVLFYIDYQRPADAAYVPSIGAQAVKEASVRIRPRIRTIDIFGRYDDRLFVLVLPETTRDGAQIIIHRLTPVVTSSPLQAEIGDVYLCLETGIGILEEGMTTSEELLTWAYQSMEGKIAPIGVPAHVS